MFQIGKSWALDEMEAIRKEEFKEKKVYYYSKGNGIPEDTKWVIYNCMFEDIGHKFVCNAFKLNLKEAIEEAYKYFYAEL